MEHIYDLGTVGYQPIIDCNKIFQPITVKNCNDMVACFVLCGAFHQSFVCELGGDGGMRKGHRPFTQRSRSREEVERGSVCVCEREREREKRSTRG